MEQGSLVTMSAEAFDRLIEQGKNPPMPTGRLISVASRWKALERLAEETQAMGFYDKDAKNPMIRIPE